MSEPRHEEYDGCPDCVRDYRPAPPAAPLDVRAAAFRDAYEAIVNVWPTDLAGISEALNRARLEGDA